MLFQGFRPALDLLLRKVFFDPTVLIKNLMNVLSLIDLIQAEGLRRSWQMPSFRIQGKRFEVFRKLFYRLRGDKAADLYPSMTLSLNFRFDFEDSPASVQTTIWSIP